MKLIEKLIIALLVIAVILKFLLVPSGGALFVLFSLLLAMLYAYFGFLLFNNIRFRNIFKKVAYNGISSWKIIGAIATGISLSIAIIGMMFKGQHYPGASFMILAGIFSALIIIIISLIKHSKKKSSYYKNIIIKTGIAVIVCSILYLVPSKFWLEIKYRNYPDYVQAYQRSLEQPNNKKVMLDWHKEYNKMHMADEEYQNYLKDIEFEKEEMALHKNVMTVLEEKKAPSHVKSLVEFDDDLTQKMINNYDINALVFKLRVKLDTLLLSDSVVGITEEGAQFTLFNLFKHGHDGQKGLNELMHDFPEKDSTIALSSYGDSVEVVLLFNYSNEVFEKGISEGKSKLFEDYYDRIVIYYTSEELKNYQPIFIYECFIPMDN